MKSRSLFVFGASAGDSPSEAVLVLAAVPPLAGVLILFGTASIEPPAAGGSSSNRF